MTDSGTFAFRLGTWRIALWMIHDFPFTGVGLGAFNAVGTRLYPLAETNHPGAHNIFLQVGVDLGLPGLVAYLSWLLLNFTLGWLTLRRAARKSDSDLHAMMAAALSGLLGYTLHGLVDNGLWNSQAAFIPWLLAALIIQAHQLVNLQSATSR
jgi:putative inorganic carbon (hco3(-)) transporter